MGRANSRGQCTAELLVAFIVLTTVLFSLYAMNDRDPEKPYEISKQRQNQRLGDLQPSQLSQPRKR